MQSMLGAPRRTWATPRGALAVWAPARGVFVSCAEGHVDLELADHIAVAGDAVIAADGRILGFHDWAQVRSYDSDARARLTNWSLRIRNEVDRAHFLVESKIVRMGVTVASIALLGMLVSYGDREEFERALREEMDARRPPREKARGR